MNRVLDPLKNNKFDGPHLIVCEGLSDAKFLKYLLDSRNLESFEIGRPSNRLEGVDSNGQGGILQYLRAIKVQRIDAKNGLDTLAVVVDSDTDPAAAFERTKGWLNQSGFASPEREFIWSRSGTPRTAIVLIPGVDSGGALKTGTLEHLLFEIVWDEAPHVHHCVEEYAHALGGHRGWSENSRAKMRIQSVIAGCCKADPCSSLAYLWSNDPQLIPVANQRCEFIADVFREVVK